MAQKAGHRYRWALTLAAMLAVAASCTEDPVQHDYVPARPAAVQPEAQGAAVDEVEACERIRTAEEAARELLQCMPLERAECPFYVRPAGSGCWIYWEDSVVACEEAIAAYTSCLDFDDRPCVLSATPTDDTCPAAPAAEGGAGGAEGSAGAGGSASGGSPAAGAAGGGAGGAGGAELGGPGGAPSGGVGG